MTLRRIKDETARLLATARGLTDADLRAPSLVPGWSRGHVLTHLARNADGGRRLLTWARTGVETPEYASVAARAAEIESGAGRSAADILHDLESSAAAFAEEHARLPAATWDAVVQWTSGHVGPVREASSARLAEVFIHHVDLDAEYTPADWPGEFAERLLADLAAAWTGSSVRLTAVDTGHSYEVGAIAPVEISGLQRSLLAWLLGRSRGDDLRGTGGPLPDVPLLIG